MKRRVILTGVLAFLAGITFTVCLIIAVLPGMMIVQVKSALNFDDTVARLEQAIEDNGWVHSQTIDMNKSLSKHGVEMAPRIRLVKLCKPEYAKDVLTSDRYVSALMPCTLAVWETDQGEVMISKMNTGLMGTLFGGNIAKVMGGAVAIDEKTILNEVL